MKLSIDGQVITIQPRGKTPSETLSMYSGT